MGKFKEFLKEKELNEQGGLPNYGTTPTQPAGYNSITNTWKKIWDRETNPQSRSILLGALQTLAKQQNNNTASKDYQTLIQTLTGQYTPTTQTTSTTT